MDFKDVDNVVIGGIDTKDYPDFANAFVLSAWHTAEDRPCTDEELDKLTESVDFPDKVRDWVF